MTQSKKEKSQSCIINVDFYCTSRKTVLCSFLSQNAPLGLLGSWISSLVMIGPYSTFPVPVNNFEHEYPKCEAKPLHFARKPMPSYFGAPENSPLFIIGFLLVMESSALITECSLPPAREPFFSSLSQGNWIKEKLCELLSLNLQSHTPGWKGNNSANRKQRSDCSLRGAGLYHTTEHSCRKLDPNLFHTKPGGFFYDLKVRATF